MIKAWRSLQSLLLPFLLRMEDPRAPPPPPLRRVRRGPRRPKSLSVNELREALGAIEAIILIRAIASGGEGIGISLAVSHEVIRLHVALGGIRLRIIGGILRP